MNSDAIVRPTEAASAAAKTWSTPKIEIVDITAGTHAGATTPAEGGASS
jgi:hypothetical protein